MKDELREKVLNLAEPLIEAQGLELWGLEITPGPTLKVALYVDGPLQGNQAPEAASLEQCESISRQLSLAMDVEDCIDQPWTLEVSTPGLERKFFKPEQLAPYIGDVLELRLNEPIEGAKRWRGRLVSVSGDKLEIEPVSVSGSGEISPTGQKPLTIGWDNVARCQRVHIFTMPTKPGHHPSSAKKK